MNKNKFDIFLCFILIIFLVLVFGTISIIETWPCPSEKSSFDLIFK